MPSPESPANRMTTRSRETTSRCGGVGGRHVRPVPVSMRVDAFEVNPLFLDAPVCPAERHVRLYPLEHRRHVVRSTERGRPHQKTGSGPRKDDIRAPPPERAEDGPAARRDERAGPAGRFAVRPHRAGDRVRRRAGHERLRLLQLRQARAAGHARAPGLRARGARRCTGSSASWPGRRASPCRGSTSARPTRRTPSPPAATRATPPSAPPPACSSCWTSASCAPSSATSSATSTTATSSSRRSRARSPA